MLELDGQCVAFLVAPEGVEETELLAVWTAVTQAGASAALMSTTGAPVQSFDAGEKADTIAPSVLVSCRGPDDLSGFCAAVTWVLAGMRTSTPHRGGAPAARSGALPTPPRLWP